MKNTIEAVSVVARESINNKEKELTDFIQERVNKLESAISGNLTNVI